MAAGSRFESDIVCSEEFSNSRAVVFVVCIYRFWCTMLGYPINFQCSDHGVGVAVIDEAQNSVKGASVRDIHHCVFFRERF